MEICVVIVTFGNKFHLLRQVVDSLVEQQIKKMFVLEKIHKNRFEQG